MVTLENRLTGKTTMNPTTYTRLQYEQLHREPEFIEAVVELEIAPDKCKQEQHRKAILDVYDLDFKDEDGYCECLPPTPPTPPSGLYNFFKECQYPPVNSYVPKACARTSSTNLLEDPPEECKLLPRISQGL